MGFECASAAGGGGGEALEDAVRNGAGLVLHEEVGAAFVLQGAATVVGVAASRRGGAWAAADRDFFGFFGAEEGAAAVAFAFVGIDVDVAFAFGATGLLDDALKLVKRRSEGLTPKQKIFFQIILVLSEF